LRRSLLRLVVVAVMLALVLAMAVPAFAVGGSGGHETIIPQGPNAGTVTAGGGGGPGGGAGGACTPASGCRGTL
jgi:hypothetical protein